MANMLYDSARQDFLEGRINWIADDVRCMLIAGSQYTPNFSAHRTLADIPAPARVTNGVPLTNKSSTGGAAAAAPVTFSAVPAGSYPVTGLILYIHDAAENLSRLLIWIDTGIGFPVEPNGGDIIVVWDTGPNKIFKL